MTREEMEHIINTKLNEYTLQLSEHLSQAVAGAVKTHVNGKIDKISRDIQPIVDFYNNITFSKKLLIGTLQVVILLATAIGAVYGFFIWLRN